ALRLAAEGRSFGQGARRVHASCIRHGPRNRHTNKVKGMKNQFLERIERGPTIVADGGMGALVTAAVPRLRCPEEANLRAPEAVVSLHVSFINAGADLIETNTFGANRRKLAAHFLDDRLEEINSTAVKLARDAREVTGRDVFIAGSIGPVGEAAASRVRRELFAEQA